ncbi:MAG: hypothetical protein PHP45_10250 [Elusimicrobiales bacterium]|nr:hypothetical protein [Elusimicrobiales bacterium]
MQAFFSAVVFLFCAVPAFCRESLPPAEGETIKQINITAVRVRESVVRSRLPVSEGMPWSARAENEVRAALHAMRIFKTVLVKSRHSAELGGAVMDISAEDGWYLLPLPFYMSGGGARMASLMLAEGNVLKRGETFFGFGLSGSNGGLVSVGALWGGWSARFAVFDINYEERHYADGAYSAGSIVSPTPRDSGAFGAVADSYNHSSHGFSASLSDKILRNFETELEFKSDTVGYSPLSGAAPQDPGRVNMLTARMRYFGGSGAAAQERTQVMSFGSIFRMGLSDLEERIRPLAAPRYFWEAGWYATGASVALDSAFDFAEIGADGLWRVESRNRHMLTLRGKAVKGFSPPFSQFIPSNRPLGLLGQYAREFRGDAGAGAVASFSFYMRGTRRGMLTCEPFAETASVWNGGQRRSRSGAGVNLRYRFWRFPIPLGVNWTRSFLEPDDVVSFSAGFGFGK